MNDKQDVKFRRWFKRQFGRAPSPYKTNVLAARISELELKLFDLQRELKQEERLNDQYEAAFEGWSVDPKSVSTRGGRCT
jgi:hypothetical protein